MASRVADAEDAHRDPNIFGTRWSTVTVPFYANARRASSFAYTLEVASGVEPTSFTPLVSASGLVANPALSSADLANNFSATWDTTSLATGLYTLRLRVTDDLGNNADGTTNHTLQGTFGPTGAGSDMDETTPEGGLGRSSDQPSHFYVAQGAFADIHGLGQLDYVAGEVGNGIRASAAGSGTPGVSDHLLSAWNATDGTRSPLSRA